MYHSYYPHATYKHKNSMKLSSGFILGREYLKSLIYCEIKMRKFEQNYHKADYNANKNIKLVVLIYKIAAFLSPNFKLFEYRL